MSDFIRYLHTVHISVIIHKLVGNVGFEPTVSCSQSKRDSQVTLISDGSECQNRTALQTPEVCVLPRYTTFAIKFKVIKRISPLFLIGSSWSGSLSIYLFFRISRIVPFIQSRVERDTSGANCRRARHLHHVLLFVYLWLVLRRNLDIKISIITTRLFHNRWNRQTFTFLTSNKFGRLGETWTPKGIGSKPIGCAILA